jgi:hypothetical protein
MAPARQRAYLQLFLGAITISDRDVEDSTEALQIVLCLSWLARLLDQASVNHAGRDLVGESCKMRRVRLAAGLSTPPSTEPVACSSTTAGLGWTGLPPSSPSALLRGRAGVLARRQTGEAGRTEASPDAAQHFDAATKILEEVDARNEYAKTLAAQADLRRRQGDVATASQLLERALAIFEKLGTLDEPARVRAAVAALQSQA